MEAKMLYYFIMSCARSVLRCSCLRFQETLQCCAYRIAGLESLELRACGRVAVGRILAIQDPSLNHAKREPLHGHMAVEQGRVRDCTSCEAGSTFEFNQTHSSIQKRITKKHPLFP